MALQLPNESDDEVLSQINTTPLVDVMLVLLIIFLITIPVVTASVPVNLPQENNQPRDSNPAIVTIVLDAQGQMYLQDQLMPELRDLEKSMYALAKNDNGVQVQLRADAQVDFAHVANVLQMLRLQAIKNVGFVLEPK